jgi:hypothetical protein
MKTTYDAPHSTVFNRRLLLPAAVHGKNILCEVTQMGCVPNFQQADENKNMTLHKLYIYTLYL